MSEGLPIGLSLGVGSIAPGEGSQVSNYFTSGTLQQTGRNTLSLPVILLLLYLTGGTLQQTGRNTLSLPVILLLL